MSDPESSTPTSFWPFLRLIARNRRLLVGVPVIVGLLVGVLVFLTPRRYESSVSFISQERSRSPSLNSGAITALASQFGLGGVPGADPTASPQFYAELLDTREILWEVLTTRFEPTEGEPQTLLTLLGVDAEPLIRAQTNGIRELRDRVFVAVSRTTGVVTLRVRMKDPELAEAVAQRFINLIDEHNVERRQTLGREERSFAEHRLEEASDSLQTAEADVLSFLRSNRVLGSPDLIAEEQRLERRANLWVDIVVGLRQAYESARIEEIRGTPSITIIQEARGFVQPAARGTIRKTVGSALLTGFVLLLVLVLKEFVLQSRSAHPAQYRAFREELTPSRE